MTEPQPLALEPVSRNAGIAVFLMLVGTALMFLLYWTPYGIDDPWITYRYAENLAKGLGFVYNEGERVLGTSTPLYTLILAVASLAGLSVPHVSWVICGLATVATLVLLFFLIRRLHSEFAAVLAVALLASAQLFVRSATWGMETPFYAALIIGAFLSYLSGRELLAAGLAGLCLVTRLDGAAVGATLFLVHVIARRGFPLRSALVFIATIAPWFLFSLAYFGSLSPNSMTAKQLHTGNHFLFWMPQWLITEPRAWLAGIGALVLLTSPAKRVGVGLLVVWAGSYSLAYTLARIHPYEWYLTPLLPILAGLAAVGVISSADWVATRFGSAQFKKIAMTLLVVALLAPDGFRAAIRVTGDEGELGLESVRYEAALWLRDSLPGEAPIASGGIGILGYYNDRQILDAMGLVTPQVVRLTEPVENPRIMRFPRFLPALLEDYDPEYVFDGFWLESDQDMPDVMLGRYERVRTWVGEDPRWPPFILYRRIHQNGG